MPPILEQLLNSDFVKLAIAFLFTVPITYNREQSTNIMGLRTFPLVAIATCSYVLVNKTFIPSGDSGAQARIVQGIVAGMGFIGGGAILKKDDHVLGTEPRPPAFGRPVPLGWLWPMRVMTSASF